jgi:hypothetical protein
MQWGSGGASNLSLEVATNINPANAAVSIAPTGTGTVTINPATASTMNNVAIGGTTPLAGTFTTATANSFIPNSATIPTNGLYLPAANAVGFATASTARMQIGATGGVSIGNTNDPGATNFSVSGSGIFGAIVTTTGSNSGFMINRRDTGANAYLLYSAAGSLQFYNSPAAADRMTLDASGNLSVTGNVVIATSGNGIDFSATAGTGTSELLADYEEGTFNAQVTDSSTPVNNAVMSAITCQYTKIGRFVHVSGNASTSSVTGLSGTIRIGGLPFAVGAATGGSIGFAAGLNITAGYSAVLTANPGNSFMQVQVWDVTTGSTAMTIAEWSDDGNIVFSFTYTV